VKHTDYRVLRKLFGIMMEKVIEDWRKLRSEKLYILYSSPKASRMIRSRKMRMEERKTQVRKMGI
jgi:hypothetical protein